MKYPVKVTDRTLGKWYSDCWHSNRECLIPEPLLSDNPNISFKCTIEDCAGIVESTNMPAESVNVYRYELDMLKEVEILFDDPEAATIFKLSME